MSEHLFKAKDAETKKWVQGYLWSERTIGVTSPCGNVDEVVVDPDTVCQYIGKTDSLGEKIFESDILLVQSRIVGCYRFVVRFGVCKESERAEREAGYIGFYLDGYDEETQKQLKHDIRNDIVFWLNECHCEVVGNIYGEMEENQRKLRFLLRGMFALAVCIVASVLPNSGVKPLDLSMGI